MILDDADIQKLITAFKKVFPTKEDLKNELAKLETSIITQVAEHIDDTIVPQLDELDTRVKKIESHKTLVQ
jgi:hypothetical protein